MDVSSKDRLYMEHILDETLASPEAPAPPAKSDPQEGEQETPTSASESAIDIQALTTFPETHGWSQTTAEVEAKYWSAYRRHAKVQDDRMLTIWRDDMDSLLIFAALFSAVVTAFIIEGYKSLTQQPEDIVPLLLMNITQQLAVISSGGTSASFLPGIIAPPEFVRPSWAIPVNTCWFGSLVLSLACALSATLVKRWAREYDHKVQKQRNDKDAGLKRQNLYDSVETWGAAEIIGLLPVLLHLSVLLFLVGLDVFLFPQDSSVFSLMTGLSGGCVVIYATLTILPLIWPDTPFSTPVSAVYLTVFQTLGNLIRQAGLQLTKVLKVRDTELPWSDWWDRWQLRRMAIEQAAVSKLDTPQDKAIVQSMVWFQGNVVGDGFALYNNANAEEASDISQLVGMLSMCSERLIRHQLDCRVESLYNRQYLRFTLNRKLQLVASSRSRYAIILWLQAFTSSLAAEEPFFLSVQIDNEWLKRTALGPVGRIQDPDIWSIRSWYMTVIRFHQDISFFRDLEWELEYRLESRPHLAVEVIKRFLEGGFSQSPHQNLFKLTSTIVGRSRYNVEPLQDISGKTCIHASAELYCYVFLLQPILTISRHAPRDPFVVEALQQGTLKIRYLSYLKDEQIRPWKEWCLTVARIRPHGAQLLDAEAELIWSFLASDNGLKSLRWYRTFLRHDRCIEWLAHVVQAMLRIDPASMEFSIALKIVNRILAVIHTSRGVSEPRLDTVMEHSGKLPRITQSSDALIYEGPFWAAAAMREKCVPVLTVTGEHLLSDVIRSLIKVPPSEPKSEHFRLMTTVLTFGVDALFRADIIHEIVDTLKGLEIPWPENELWWTVRRAIMWFEVKLENLNKYLFSDSLHMEDGDPLIELKQSYSDYYAIHPGRRRSRQWDIDLPWLEAQHHATNSSEESNKDVRIISLFRRFQRRLLPKKSQEDHEMSSVAA